MALVKCPECGKENVSSTASACPQCGFNIKEYYEDLERKERNEKRQAAIERNIKTVSNQAASLKKGLKINKSFFRQHKKLSLIVCCILIILISIIVRTTFTNHHYPIVINNKTIYLGDSRKSIKRKYGKKYTATKNFTLIKDEFYVALEFDESNQLSKASAEGTSKGSICGIQIGEPAVDVFDDLGLDDFNMDDSTENVLITLKNGKAQKAYGDNSDLSDFKAQKIIKDSDAVLALKFDDLKVSTVGISDSQYVLKNTY